MYFCWDGLSSHPNFFIRLYKYMAKFYKYLNHKCKLLKVFELSKDDLPYTVSIAKLFYLENGLGRFRYAYMEDVEITDEDCDILEENDLELVQKYGSYMHWVEDEVYNLVNYDGKYF